MLPVEALMVWISHAVRGLAGMAGLALLLAGPAVPAAAQGDTSAEQETPKNIIADQIRRQGFACKTPQDAKRDPAANRPDAPVWILDCGDATYRVRLKPDMAADVEKVD